MNLCEKSVSGEENNDDDVNFKNKKSCPYCKRKFNCGTGLAGHIKIHLNKQGVNNFSQAMEQKMSMGGGYGSFAAACLRISDDKVNNGENLDLSKTDGIAASREAHRGAGDARGVETSRSDRIWAVRDAAEHHWSARSSAEAKISDGIWNGRDARGGTIRRRRRSAGTGGAGGAEAPRSDRIWAVRDTTEHFWSGRPKRDLCHDAIWADLRSLPLSASDQNVTVEAISASTRSGRSVRGEEPLKRAERDEEGEMNLCEKSVSGEENNDDDVNFKNKKSCPYCKRKFNCGRGLAGHIKIHLNKQGVNNFSQAMEQKMSMGGGYGSFAAACLRISDDKVNNGENLDLSKFLVGCGWMVQRKRSSVETKNKMVLLKSNSSFGVYDECDSDDSCSWF
ncbi:hypothetical protein VNO78_12372 [Psophocarpus tetragonolobus]|uniref:C2H2-type domain-containing protein n=1 Tax=Psophocarpus tetragonolobus TaxID=3891 RepID=A0AAN9SMW2_PSOTE